MGSLTKRLSRLGSAIASVDRPDAAAISEARERWAEHGTPSRSRMRIWLLAPALAAVGVTIAIVATRPDPVADLTFEVDHARGTEGDWVSAEHAPRQLSFSDGSRVELASTARLRVTTVDARGSTVDLERGTLHASIVHAGATRWSFRAGPYSARVTGTRFSTTWDPALSKLTLDMFEGSVELRGPLIETSVVVAAGHSVIATVSEQRFELIRRREGDAARVKTADAAPTSAPATAAASSVVTATVIAPAAAALATTSPGAASVTSAPGSASVTAPARAPVVEHAPSPAHEPTVASAPEAPRKEEPSWRELLAAGASSRALVAAERSGFEQVLRDATRAELYALADAARYAGRFERARDSLLALRTRFSEKGKPAFLLGRILADRSGSELDAIGWFETYLREAPSGSLADAATGRLIELYRVRDPARARSLAAHYLETYPGGAHAALARSVVAP